MLIAKQDCFIEVLVSKIWTLYETDFYRAGEQIPAKMTNIQDGRGTIEFEDGTEAYGVLASGFYEVPDYNCRG